MITTFVSNLPHPFHFAGTYRISRLVVILATRACGSYFYFLLYRVVSPLARHTRYYLATRSRGCVEQSPPSQKVYANTSINSTRKRDLRKQVAGQ